MTIRSVVMGIGTYLPEQVVTNHDLAKRMETSHDWIVERTGIHSRRVAKEGEYTSHLAVKAGQEALKNSGINPSDIDHVIVATTTPDETMPSTATKVQYALGITNGGAFDINAACSGFVYALHVADSLIVSGKAKRILVIGAETFSRILDWNDRNTAILFGDGAGALVLEAQKGKGDNSDRGILYTAICSNGEYRDILKTDGGISVSKTAGFVYMAGKEVFRHAVEKMSSITQQGMEKLGFSSKDLDLIVPHQANYRILASVAKKIDIQDDKVVSTVREHANTSAASIPLALAETLGKSRLKKGDLVAIPALGAGLTWGACILRW